MSRGAARHAPSLLALFRGLAVTALGTKSRAINMSGVLALSPSSEPIRGPAPRLLCSWRPHWLWLCPADARPPPSGPLAPPPSCRGWPSLPPGSPCRLPPQVSLTTGHTASPVVSYQNLVNSRIALLRRGALRAVCLFSTMPQGPGWSCRCSEDSGHPAQGSWGALGTHTQPAPYVTSVPGFSLVLTHVSLTGLGLPPHSASRRLGELTSPRMQRGACQMCVRTAGPGPSTGHWASPGLPSCPVSSLPRVVRSHRGIALQSPQFRMMQFSGYKNHGLRRNAYALDDRVQLKSGNGRVGRLLL